LAQERPVLVLTGARQTGKTSLLKKLFPSYAFVSLDLPSEAEAAEKNPEAFLERHSAPLIIDEIQYAPAIFRHLKRRVDQHRTRKGQYLLTGSQKFTLMRGLSDSLAGRVELFELESLSFPEIIRAYPKTKIEQVIGRGGYPELYDNIELNAFSFYRSYVATYLERDLRTLLDVGNLRDFERFLRACALRSGQLLNQADLARDVGVSPSTAKAWISVLVASNLIVLLEPWFLNQSKSMTKSPKIFFADTGLLLFLLNIQTLDDFLKSPLLGNIWETFVFAEIRKAQVRNSGSWSLHFWRDRHKEVDFLIHRGGRFELIEVKWSENPSPHDAARLEQVANVVGNKRVIRTSIICRTPNRYPITPAVEALPLIDYVE
jgi:predicted AAA+ superfamily ATPase